MSIADWIAIGTALVTALISIGGLIHHWMDDARRFGKLEGKIELITKKDEE